MRKGKMNGRLGRLGLPRTIAILYMVAGVVSVLTLATPAQAFQLITPTEAALSPAMIPTFEPRGSPTRRPTIVVVWPAPDAGAVHSPLDLKLIFRAFGGAKIDRDSVLVTYLKQPPIDLTQRLKPFITADGIDAPGAEVPPGTHQFWVELKDMDGRIGGNEFSFQVTK